MSQIRGIIRYLCEGKRWSRENGKGESYETSIDKKRNKGYSHL